MNLKIVNHSTQEFIIQNEKHVAQLVITSYVKTDWEEAAELTTSVRNEEALEVPEINKLN